MSIVLYYIIIQIWKDIYLRKPAWIFPFEYLVIRSHDLDPVIVIYV